MSTRTAAVLAFASLTLVTSFAAAQDPAPATPPPAAPPPAEAPAGVAAPALDAAPITPTCSLGDHPGVAEAEARTAADVICHELARQGASGARHEVRFGVLGGQTLMTLSSWRGSAYDERRALIAGMGEVPVAGPRLVSALVDGKPVEDTRNVDNVLTSETRRAKQQNGTMGFDGGFFGTTGVGASAGSSAGLSLGLLYRASNVGLSVQGRAGGIGSGDDKMSLATLDAGGRYYLTLSETAPFVGAGLGLSHFHLDRAGLSDLQGSGFGGHVIAGVEFLRSHHVAFSASVRADLPFYRLEGFEQARGETRSYVVPLSFNLGLLFH